MFREIQPLERLPYGFRLRPPAVILSGAQAESNCVAVPNEVKAGSRADFAQDDTRDMACVKFNLKQGSRLHSKIPYPLFLLTM